MTDEERQRWHEEKGAQHQRACDFLAEARPGDSYKIERYAIYEVGVPYALSRFANIRNKQTVTLYAVHNEPGAQWFTTTKGEAIEADSLIKWERQPIQQELAI